MLEHILHKVDTEAIAARAHTDSEAPAATAIEEIKRKIDMFHVKSRQGLWNMAIFILVSIVALALADTKILAGLPHQVQMLLGAPPAPYLIHIVLVVSTVSAIIILGGRIANGAEPGWQWEQLLHRAAFYLFYLLSDALEENFIAVFAAGLAVLLLEHYHISVFFAKAISHERHLMKKISLWPLLASQHR